MLQNWLADEPDTGCSIVVAEGPLAGRKIFVYAGNMGVAQGMDVLLDLAEKLQGRKDITNSNNMALPQRHATSAASTITTIRKTATTFPR